jgi:hypothetical protein
MDTSQFPRIESLEGIRSLFVDLGYGSVEEAGEDLSTVARWKRFRVLAVTDPEPRDRARVEAKRLSRAGECAMIAVLAPSRELVLAAPMPTASGLSRILVVDLQVPDRAVCRMLADLRPNGSANALAHALKVGEVLSTEAAGERFFTAFRVVLERMAASLDRRHTLADRRLATLIALMRVLFLYFVQEKGWLDGRRDFLPTLLDDALTRRRTFHRRVLEPLFFGTLNRPVVARSRHVGFGQVPYLNGGLFEPHAVERRVGVCFDNAMWRDAFDQLFQRFRFCVREDDEVDAVAPDMLGRVFERLMAPEDRLDTGSFYTPEAVVRQVVDATVETALWGRGGLAEHVAERLVRRHEVEPRHRDGAARAVAQLRLLDPAAGSGAFLLGALDSLTEIGVCLASAPSSILRTRIRRQVLRHNLFGVDVNPIAVRLAELRLWLAVVAEDPTEAIADVAPLPNLNGIVRQGDSLLDPLAVSGMMRPSGETHAAQKEVEARRRELFAAHGAVRGAALSALQCAERRLARPLLENALRRVECGARDLVGARAPRDLFGESSQSTAAEREALRAARRRHAELSRALRELEDGAVPFFSFDVQVPETMAGGGFAAVIGNPPWVRAERLSATRRAQLRDRFAWWRSGEGRGYQHLPDLALAFLERAIELTAPGGAVGMLVPSKLVSAGYGERARQHLVSETRIAYLHRVPDRESQRFGATTYPLAVVIQNRAPMENAVIRLVFGGPPVLKQERLRGTGPWILVPDRARDALDAFRWSATPLGSVAPPALGVKTGADDLFVGELLERHGTLARIRFGVGDVELEAGLLRPAVRGRDVRAFSISPTRYILWTHDRSGRPRMSLPPRAAGHIAAHHGRLIARADYRGARPWCLFRIGPALARYRVVWRDLTRRPAAVFLDSGGANSAVPMNTCYVAAMPDDRSAHAVTAVLNSTWASALVHVMADEARGGYRRMNARVAGLLPVPTAEAAAPLVALSTDLHHTRTSRDRDLDDAVADALGLAPRTRNALRQLAAHLG